MDLLANQPPPDFFHDPFGQFIVNVAVAVIVGIVTALVAIWIFRKQRSKKEISYQVISNAPIATINKQFENRVAIMLDGQFANDVRQVVLKIRNSGNAAVKQDDYNNQMKFVFEGSEVIGGDVFNTEPESLINLIEKDFFVAPYVREQNLKIGAADSALLMNTLLNPKDSITFTVLLKGAYKKLEVRGRIIDGEIVKYSDKQSFDLSAILIISIAIGGLIISLLDLFSIINLSHIYIYLLIIIILLLILLYMTRLLRLQRRLQ